MYRPFFIPLSVAWFQTHVADLGDSQEQPSVEGRALGSVVHGGASCVRDRALQDSKARATHSPPSWGPRTWRLCFLPAAGNGVGSQRRGPDAAKRQVQSRDAGVPAARYPATPRLWNRTWELDSVSERVVRG